MNRPNITAQEAQQYIAGAKASIAATLAKHVASGRIKQQEADKHLQSFTTAANLPVMVLAIRGYFKNSMGKAGANDRGIYDDAFVLIGPNYIKTFNANTDPRREKQGIANLLPGWYQFKQGIHNYKNPQQAFRTANAGEVLPVLRDGEKGIKDGHTINIHSGGMYSTNSAGCQTVFAGQWPEFKKDAYQLMDKEAQRVLPYLLIEI